MEAINRKAIENIRIESSNELQEFVWKWKLKVKKINHIGNRLCNGEYLEIRNFKEEFELRMVHIFNEVYTRDMIKTNIREVNPIEGEIICAKDIVESNQ